jgi:ABC-2 type transport system ATP-binding protein
MSSHSFDEIERTCDRAGIIRKGRLVAVEDITVLRAAQRKTYLVTFASQDAAVAFAQTDFTIISTIASMYDPTVPDSMDGLIATLPPQLIDALSF